MIDRAFWRNKRVFLTGHTGFKGSWLSLWLHSLGAKVTGYALAPTPPVHLFGQCQIDDVVHSVIADVRGKVRLKQEMSACDPEIVIHMAAQPLVRESYKNPVETYEINIMGTIHLLEAVRHIREKNNHSHMAVLIVTTDKCYENKEWIWGYRESDRLGGYDPYSNSKACCELVTSSYRNSYFNPKDYDVHGVGIATARAGNVIGGGDWSVDRLIPDCVRSLLKGEAIKIRYPGAVRPWQHVLDPLSGYLTLAQNLYENGPKYSEGWNFGPQQEDAQTVEWIVRKLVDKWGGDASYQLMHGQHLHEAEYLTLDCSKARMKLGWRPTWDVDQALDKVVEWVQAYKQGQIMKEVCLKQISEFMK